MCRNVLLLFCLPLNSVINKGVCAIDHGLSFTPEDLKTCLGTSFTGYFITSLDYFFLLFNNLEYEFMSVLWYCHQKEDQNSD